MVPTIAQALGLRETGGLSPEETLERFLKDLELLLVLDNLEHLLTAAPAVSELVLRAPRLKAILSSRAPLRVSVSGNTRFPARRRGRGFPVQRTGAGHQAGFPSERQLGNGRGDLSPPGRSSTCDRQLAAARANVLSPAALLERLDQRLPVLTEAFAKAPTASARSEARSPGATSCLTSPSVGSSLGSPFSLAVARSTRPSGCARRTSTPSPRSSRRALSGRATTDSGCCRPSEKLPSSGSRRVVSANSLAPAPRLFLAFASLKRSKISSTKLTTARASRSRARQFPCGSPVCNELGDPASSCRLVSALRPFWHYRSHLREGLERIREALDRNPGASAEIRGPARVPGC